MDVSPLKISLFTAFVSTLITFFLGLIAGWLVCYMKRGKGVVDAVFSLPLVLPPTVVGFFLLIFFGKNSAFGRFFSGFGIKIVFDIKGAVIAAALVSFPIMYRTIRAAIEQVDVNLIYAARTLGLGEVEIFRKIIVPEAFPGIAAGIVLSFARAMGEFGATIMIAGNIPGKTRTMSVAVYSAMQGGNRELAYKWVLIIMSISFISIILMNAFIGIGNRKKKKL